MKLTSGRDRLTGRAVVLKKGWLLLAVSANVRLSDAELTIPDYATWPKKRLQTHCDYLEADVEEVLALIITNPKIGLKPASIRWLADQCDRWQESGGGVFTLSTVQQFEARVGRLNARRNLEVPPYAEVLLQPGVGVALRHPEYMLVRDLGLLLDLYLDAEALCDSIKLSRPPTWAGAAGENVQALARSTIQASFNLLESFVAGLARAHVMEHPDLDRSSAGRLLGTREPLKKRIRSIPGAIVGRECPLTLESYPLQPLFNNIKRRRDAFVHCEPGSFESEHGYVKESAFHDIPRELVPLTVRATHDAIREVWRFVHGSDGPRWLPPLESSGRFGKANLSLVPRQERAAV